MSSYKAPKNPDPVKQRLRQNLTGEVLYQDIYKRCNEENKHFMGAIVGREGSGKSYSALRIGELVDPGFHAGRVMFDPASFLERLRSEETGPGDVVVLDEAGVGVGSRTWYDRDQIMLNQVLQVVRDENMAAIFTLPRLSELDSQARGRLIAFGEMTQLNKGEGYAEMKYKRINPTRDDRDKLYKQYPRINVDGVETKVNRIRLTHPSEELAENYEQRKADFKEGLYEEAIELLRGEDDSEAESKSPQEVAAEIKENGIDQFVATHNGNGTKYLDRDLIQMEYDLSHRKARQVKKSLESDESVSIE